MDDDPYAYNLYNNISDDDEYGININEYNKRPPIIQNNDLNNLDDKNKKLPDLHVFDRDRNNKDLRIYQSDDIKDSHYGKLISPNMPIQENFTKKSQIIDMEKTVNLFGNKIILWKIIMFIMFIIIIVLLHKILNLSNQLKFTKDILMFKMVNFMT